MRNTKTLIAASIAVLFTALPASAQKAPVASSVTASEPGKAAMADTITASAIVTAIDKATRKVTMKNAKGESFDIVAGAEVKNFDQIAVGDELKVLYVRALSMKLQKPGAAAVNKDTADAVRAKAGEKPAGAIGRQVTVTADVTDVNPTAKTITLKGPKGNVIELDVKNPDQFKVVKKGDKVDVEYTEALAISVETVAKAAAPKAAAPAAAPKAAAPKAAEPAPKK